MHGKHSWYVEGASDEDLVVGQTLREEVVEYIRNRKGIIHCAYVSFLRFVKNFPREGVRLWIEDGARKTMRRA